MYHMHHVTTMSYYNYELTTKVNVFNVYNTTLLPRVQTTKFVVPITSSKDVTGCSRHHRVDWLQ